MTDHHDSQQNSSGKEVFIRDGGPLEAPTEKIEKGHLYKMLSELDGEPDDFPQDDEIDAQGPTLEVDRRDFMRLFSTTALVGTAACVRRPEEKVIAYVEQPADQMVGIPALYATTCGECPSACGVIVKVREGRPRKIEGHEQHPMNSGATCALGQAAIQTVYHPDRRKAPLLKRGNRVDSAQWDEVFEILGAEVKETAKIGIFTNGSTGHRHGFFEEFLTRMGSSPAKLYTYEANTLYAAIAEAHNMTMGRSIIPRLDLNGVRNVVGIGTDFLNTGTHPVYSSKLFAASHGFDAEKPFAQSLFTQFESNYTATGGKADHRHVIAPGSEVVIALALLKELVGSPRSLGGGSATSAARNILVAHDALLNDLDKMLPGGSEKIRTLATSLMTEPSVVICGSGDSFDQNATNLQLLAVHINIMIGAYDRFLHVSKGAMRSPVRSDSLQKFKAEAPDLDILFIIDSNPAFTLPASYGFADSIKNIKTIVSMQASPNETDELATYKLPNTHYLESWGDEQPADGFWSLRQPAVRNTTDSRQAEDVLLWIAATVEKPMPFKSYHDYIQKQWGALHKSSKEAALSFKLFFQSIQRQGFYGNLMAKSTGLRTDVSSRVKILAPTSGLRLLSPLDTRLLDGRGANTPLLQEVGDAMTTIAWDSWLAIHPDTAKSLGLRIYDEVTVEADGGKPFNVGVYPVPGLHRDTVVVPRGNGHKLKLNRVSDNVGVDPLVAYSGGVDSVIGYPVTSNIGVTLSKTGRRIRIAHMQKPTAELGNRTDIVKKATRGEASESITKKVDLDTAPDLYPKLPNGDYRWGMSIDLTKCSGCSACMVACAVENNIPQVGRKMITQGREMHWIRLDRYFEGPVDNPQVTLQPMMCQHCNHAPCEAVCPVYATTHDDEGINTQTYNRCVGTRYCANACPYKVRRFNWFTQRWNVPLNPRALNPDVTVRTRGIMEKCTFCVQRIRDAKHNLIGTGQKIADAKPGSIGELQTACQQVCPSDAIDFGNLLDEKSIVGKKRKDSLSYLALGGDPEIGHYGIKTLPNVSYVKQIVAQKFEHKTHSKDGEHSDPHAPKSHG